MNESFEAFCAAQLARAEDFGLKRIGSLKNLDDTPCVPNDRLCLGMECLDRELWDLKPALTELSRLGIGRARLQSGWAKTESVPGVYDFAWLDEQVDDLRRIGIQPWLSLSYGNPIYDTTHQSSRPFGLGHVPLNSPEEIAAWQAYVQATVRHFAGRVSEFEIWNEPDVAVFFPYGTAWMEKYLAFVQLTAQSIRTANANATVIGCCGNAKYLSRLLAQGIGKDIDIFSFHNYSEFPERFGAQTRRMLASYRDRYAPHVVFWRGEAGCPSYNPPTSIGALHGMKTSDLIQAKWVLRHLLPDLADSNMALTSYFHAYEFEHFSHQHHYYYGILRHPDCARKPSFETLQVLTHLIDANAAPADDLSLFLRNAENGTLSEADLLGSPVLSFRRNGAPLACYWRATVLDDASDYELCALKHDFLPEQWQNAVLIDPLTRAVYAFDFENAPITDYPLIVAEPDAIADLVTPETAAAIGRTTAVQEAHTQTIEE